MSLAAKDPHKIFSENFRREYGIESLVGSGSWGAVYRGKQPGLGRDVAVKVLILENSDDVAIARFEQEARLAARVSHPNVVSIYASGLDGNLPYIVYQFIEGDNLKKTIKEQGPLPIDQSISTVTAISSGIHAIHESGVIHRDIKSENIIIDRTGKPFVTDLGIAKDGWAKGVRTKTGFVLGTPEYMAPEYVSQGEASRSSDIYSLGVLLFECLAGHTPFTGNLLDIITSHMKSKPPALPERVPEALKALVDQMLIKSPGDRPASARELAEKLASIGRAINKADSSSILGKPLSGKSDVPSPVKTILSQVKTNLPPVKTTQPPVKAALSPTVIAEKAQEGVTHPSQTTAIKYHWKMVLLFFTILLLMLHSFYKGAMLNSGSKSSVSLISPISASIEEFSNILSTVRQNRDNLSKEEQRWLFRSIRLGHKIGQEKVFKLLPVINLLPFDEEHILLRAHMVATLNYRYFDNRKHCYLLAKKLIEQCLSKSGNPRLTRLLKGVNFIVGSAAQEINFYTSKEEARVKKLCGDHLDDALQLLNDKEFLKYNAYDFCLFAKMIVRYGDHLHIERRETVFYPTIMLLKEKLRMCPKESELSRYVEEHLLEVHGVYFYFKSPAYGYSPGVLSPDELVILMKKLIQRTEDYRTRAWLKLLQGRLTAVLMSSPVALKSFENLIESKMCKESPLYQRALLSSIVNMAIEAARIYSTTKEEKKWAIETTLECVPKLQGSVSGRMRQVLFINLSELYLYNNQFDTAKKLLTEVVELGKDGDRDLAHTATEKLFAIGQGYNPSTDKERFKYLK